MENIVISFSADTTQLKTTLDLLVQTGKVTEADAKAFLALGEASKKAGTETEQSVKKASSGVSGFSSQLENLGRTIATTFAVERIIAFGNAAVKAFGESQKAQIQLLAALSGQEAVQKRLIKQADELQEAFGIDNDTIVKQQAFLALQGRTEEQINKTIRAAIQLSAVTGEDLQSSISKLDGTFEGNIGRLGKLDSRFNDLTKSQLANGGAIDLINEKYKGFAEAGAASVSGQLEIQQRKLDDLTKSIGKDLAPTVVGLKTLGVQIADFFLKISGNAAQVATAFGESIGKKKGISKAVEEAAEDIKKPAGDIIVTLQSLKDALEKLKTEQLKIADPTGAGSAANAANLKSQADIQKKIDEITGKAAEDRAKREKEIREKAHSEEERSTKDRLQRENKAFEDALQVDLSNLEEEKQRELQLLEKTEGGLSIQERLRIDEKYLELKKALFKDNAVEQAKIDTDIANVKTKITEQANKDNIEALEAHSKQQEKFREADVDATKKSEQQKREEIQKTLDAVKETIDQSISIFKEFSNARISALEDEKNEVLSKDEEEIQSLENKFRQGHIGQRKYDIQLKALQDKKLADQKKIDAEILEQKRKQAIADKILALFNLAIDAPQAISKTLAIGGFFALPLAILVGALIAVQAAAIIAAPLPKFHKGRLAQTDRGEELAVIRKDETIFDPDQSREYAPTFRAIYHKQIKPNILNDYVNFKLKSFNTNQSSTIDTAQLARDIAWELRDHKDIKIKNMSELGAEIAKHIPQPDPRKW